MSFNVFISVNPAICDETCDYTDVVVEKFASSLPRHTTSDARQEKFAVKRTTDDQFTISYLVKGKEIFKREYPDPTELGVGIGEITPVTFRGENALFISYLYGAGGTIQCFNIISYSQKSNSFNAMRITEKDLPDVVGTSWGERARKSKSLEKEFEQERSEKQGR